MEGELAVIDRERWQALEPLLDQALGLSTEQQAVWLNELTVSALTSPPTSGAALESAADRRAFCGAARLTSPASTRRVCADVRSAGSGGSSGRTASMGAEAPRRHQAAEPRARDRDRLERFRVRFAAGAADSSLRDFSRRRFGQRSAYRHRIRGRQTDRRIYPDTRSTSQRVRLFLQ
jgi:hypothetical protein